MKRFLHSRTALFVGVAVVAIVVAGALIGFSLSSGSKAEPATSPVLPVTTTNESTGATGTTVEPKVTGAAATAALFRGIPQHLNQLGNPNAKVTLIEFADPQCPFCRQFALDALPALVKEYIRTGKVKLVVFGIEAIGPNSVDGLRAIYAAGLQGKLWNVFDLLYRNQGAENSGWITDDLLRRVGNSVPGLQTGRMMADRQSSDVDGALAASAQQATNARVRATPTFFAGRTGGTLQQLPITALTPDAFRPALNSLLG